MITLFVKTTSLVILIHSKSSKHWTAVGLIMNIQMNNKRSLQMQYREMQNLGWFGCHSPSFAQKGRRGWVKPGPATSSCHHASRQPSGASPTYSQTWERQPTPLPLPAKPPHRRAGSSSCMEDTKGEKRGRRSEGGRADARAGGNKMLGDGEQLEQHRQ